MSFDHHKNQIKAQIREAELEYFKRMNKAVKLLENKFADHKQLMMIKI